MGRSQTRLLGGLIMTHADDDGMRTPPRIAPQQIVIIPILRDEAQNQAVLNYCETLQKSCAHKPWTASPYA